MRLKILYPLWLSLLCFRFSVASDETFPAWAFDCNGDDQFKRLSEYVDTMGPPSISVLPRLLAAIESNRAHYNEGRNINNLSAVILLGGIAHQYLKEFGGYPGSLPLGIWSYYLDNLSKRKWQLVCMFLPDRTPEELFYYLQIPKSELTADLRQTIKALFPFPNYKLVDVAEGCRIEESLVRDQKVQELIAQKAVDVAVLLKITEVYRYKDYYWVSWAAHPTANGGHSALLRVIEPDTSGKEVIVLDE
jgi:hypothetical protein